MTSDSIIQDSDASDDDGPRSFWINHLQGPSTAHRDDGEFVDAPQNPQNEVVGNDTTMLPREKNIAPAWNGSFSVNFDDFLETRLSDSCNMPTASQDQREKSWIGDKEHGGSIGEI